VGYGVTRPQSVHSSAYLQLNVPFGSRVNSTLDTSSRIRFTLNPARSGPVKPPVAVPPLTRRSVKSCSTMLPPPKGCTTLSDPLTIATLCATRSSIPFVMSSANLANPGVFETSKSTTPDDPGANTLSQPIKASLGTAEGTWSPDCIRPKGSPCAKQKAKPTGTVGLLVENTPAAPPGYETSKCDPSADPFRSDVGTPRPVSPQASAMSATNAAVVLERNTRIPREVVKVLYHRYSSTNDADVREALREGGRDTEMPYAPGRQRVRHT